MVASAWRPGTNSRLVLAFLPATHLPESPNADWVRTLFRFAQNLQFLSIGARKIFLHSRTVRRLFSHWRINGSSSFARPPNRAPHLRCVADFRFSFVARGPHPAFANANLPGSSARPTVSQHDNRVRLRGNRRRNQKPPRKNNQRTTAPSALKSRSHRKKHSRRIEF